MAETSRDRARRAVRRGAVEQMYRSYTTLVLEHERVRRSRGGLTLDVPWQPEPGAWNTLRFLAFVHDPERRPTRVLAELFTRHEPVEATQAAQAPRVPRPAWRRALEAGVDLVADVLVARGAELPWGRTKPRVPRNRDEFENVCRFLRDQELADDGRPTLGQTIDAAELSPLPPRRPRVEHRVTFHRGSQLLAIDGVRMSLPLGREVAFLTFLAERRQCAEVTPRFEHEIDWKSASDQLRRRILKATGSNLLPAVVLAAKGPTGGYRLAPGVRVRTD